MVSPSFSGRKHILVSISLLLVLIFLPSQAGAVTTYRLNVKPGDWMEYSVEKSTTFVLRGVMVEEGDRIRIEVVDIGEREAIYRNGEIAYLEEYAIFDLYLNGRRIGEDDEDPAWFEMVKPHGDQYWRSFEALRTFNTEYLRQFIVNYGLELNMSGNRMTRILEVRASTSNDEYNRSTEVYDMKTGILVEGTQIYEVLQYRKSDELHLVLVDTNVSGISNGIQERQQGLQTPMVDQELFLLTILGSMVVLVVALGLYGRHKPLRLEANTKP